MVAGNLITSNCGFEITSTWLPWAFAWDPLSDTSVGGSNDVHSGANALMVASTPGSDPDAWMSAIGTTFATTVGAMYRVDFWVKGGGTEGLSHFYAGYRDALVSGSGLYSVVSYSGSLPIWSRYVRTFVATSTSTWFGFVFRTDSGTSYKFDDVVVTAQPVVSGVTATRAKGMITVHFTEQAGLMYQCQLKPSAGWITDCHNLSSWRSAVKQVSVRASSDGGWTFGLPYTVTVTRG